MEARKRRPIETSRRTVRKKKKKKKHIGVDDKISAIGWQERMEEMVRETKMRERRRGGGKEGMRGRKRGEGGGGEAKRRRINGRGVSGGGVDSWVRNGGGHFTGARKNHLVRRRGRGKAASGQYRKQCKGLCATQRQKGRVGSRHGVKRGLPKIGVKRSRGRYRQTVRKGGDDPLRAK